MKKFQNEDFASQIKIVKANLFIDISTFIPVIIIAIFSNSLVLVTDVFDYVFTISSEIIFFIVLRKCIKNETTNYDFGLGKMQSMAALFTSVIMIIGLLILMFEAIQRFFIAETIDFTFAYLGVGVHTIGFGVNFYLWQSAYKIWKNTKSPIINSQWRVNRANALGNIGVLISLILTLSFSEFGWSCFIDPISALIFAIITINSFITLFKNSMNDLLDKSIEEELQLKILKVLADYEYGYERFYDYYTRKSGNKIFIDIKLGFDPAKKIGDAMNICSRIKEKLEYYIKGSDVNVIMHTIEDFEETLIKVREGLIVPLSEEHLEDCMRLSEAIWGEYEDIEKIKLEYLGSIDPIKYKKELDKLGFLETRYWVGIYEGKLIGLSGIYFQKGDDEAVWGGWMAKDPESGRMGYKVMSNLMWKVVFEARQTGRKYFRVYTSNLEIEKEANKLYDNSGINIYKIEKGEHFDVLYRQALLEDLYEKYRPGKKKHYKRKTE